MNPATTEWKSIFIHKDPPKKGPVLFQFDNGDSYFLGYWEDDEDICGGGWYECGDGIKIMKGQILWWASVIPPIEDGTEP